MKLVTCSNPLLKLKELLEYPTIIYEDCLMAKVPRASCQIFSVTKMEFVEDDGLTYDAQCIMGIDGRSSFSDEELQLIDNAISVAQFRADKDEYLNTDAEKDWETFVRNCLLGYCDNDFYANMDKKYPIQYKLIDSRSNYYLYYWYNYGKKIFNQKSETTEPLQCISGTSDEYSW